MWNNRIVKHKKDDTVWYSVHEVFYNENGGINGYTEDPISIVGETVEEVKSQLEMITKDIEKHEVIDASTVKFEDWFSDKLDVIEDEVKMDKTKFKIRKLHDEEYREKFIQCDCWGEGLLITKFDDDEEMYFSYWHQGINPIKLSWWMRLKLCWMALTKGNVYDDQVVLSKEKAMELALWIQNEHDHITEWVREMDKEANEEK